MVIRVGSFYLGKSGIAAELFLFGVRSSLVRLENKLKNVVIILKFCREILSLEKLLTETGL